MSASSRRPQQSRASSSGAQNQKRPASASSDAAAKAAVPPATAARSAKKSAASGAGGGSAGGGLPAPSPEKYSASGRGLAVLPDFGSSSIKLSFVPTALRHLDVSDNEITDISPLTALVSLRHLNLSKNRVADLAPLSALCKTLAVLDVSSQKNNALRTLRGLFRADNNSSNSSSGGSAAKKSKSKGKNGDKTQKQQQQQQSSVAVYSQLKAIIANDNAALATLGFFAAATELAVLTGAVRSSSSNNKKKRNADVDDDDGIDDEAAAASLGSPLPVLETLVVSRDRSLNTTVVDGNAGDDDDEDGGENETLWQSLSVVATSLRKLSVAECGIREISPTLTLPLLGELRLAKNHFTHFPPSVKLRSLQILDVSACPLKRSGFLTISRFLFLKQVSVAGTPEMLRQQRRIERAARREGDGGDEVQQRRAELLLFWKTFEFLRLVDGKKLEDMVKQVDADAYLSDGDVKRKRRRVQALLEEMAADGFAEEEDEDPSSNDDDDDDNGRKAVVDKDDDDEEEMSAVGHGAAPRETPSRRGRVAEKRSNGEDEGEEDDALSADAFLKRAGLASVAAGGAGGKGSKAIASVRRRGGGSSSDYTAEDAKQMLVAAAAKAHKVVHDKW